MHRGPVPGYQGAVSGLPGLLQQQSLIKKYTTNLPPGQSDGGNSLMEVPSSKVTLVCVRLRKHEQSFHHNE